MDAMYTFAQSFVSGVNPIGETGGLVGRLLSSVNISAEAKVDLPIKAVITSDISIAFSQNGYAVAIAFGCIFCLALLSAAVVVWQCRLRCPPARHRAENGTRTPVNGSLLRRDKSSRHKCPHFQPYMLASMGTLNMLLLLSCVLGLATTIELYVHGTSELDFGRNASLIYQPDNNRLMKPQFMFAFDQVRIYLRDFVENTLNDTRPEVDALIAHSQAVQRNLSWQFSDTVEKEIGAGQLIRLSQTLIDCTLKIHELVAAVLNVTEKIIDINLASRLREFQGNLSSFCKKTELCQAPVATAYMSQPPTSQDMYGLLKEVISAGKPQEQVNKTQRQKAEQVNKSLAAFAERFDLEAAIRQQTNAQWDALRDRLPKPELMDRARDTAYTYLTTAGLSVQILFALFLFMWFVILALVFFFSWIIYQRFFVSTEMSYNCRSDVRMAGCIGFVILAVLTTICTVVYLTAGYPFTAIFRFLDQRYSATGPIGQRQFVLDVHVNEFLDRSWPVVLAMTAKMGMPPPPRPRHLLHALAIGCRENQGIAQALGAIDSYNFTATVDTELPAKISRIGKEIMLESIDNMTIDTLVKQSEREMLKSAGLIDSQFKKLTPIAINLNVGEPPLEWDAYVGRVEEAYPELQDEKEAAVAAAWAQVSAVWRKLRAAGFEFNRLVARNNELARQRSQLPNITNITEEMQVELDKIQARLTSEKAQLKARLSKRYHEEIAAKSLPTTIESTRIFGPRVLAQVGKCKRLNLAYEAIYHGFSDGILGPLNGLWLFTGLCVLLCAILLCMSVAYPPAQPTVTQVPVHGSEKTPCLGPNDPPA